jgi:hypothetical protein
MSKLGALWLNFAISSLIYIFIFAYFSPIFFCLIALTLTFDPQIMYYALVLVFFQGTQGKRISFSLAEDWMLVHWKEGTK